MCSECHQWKAKQTVLKTKSYVKSCIFGSFFHRYLLRKLKIVGKPFSSFVFKRLTRKNHKYASSKLFVKWPLFHDCLAMDHPGWTSFILRNVLFRLGCHWLKYKRDDDNDEMDENDWKHNPAIQDTHRTPEVVEQSGICYEDEQNCKNLITQNSRITRDT